MLGRAGNMSCKMLEFHLMDACQQAYSTCIHILRWSFKRSVKRTWTNFPRFSTNESA